MRFKYLGNQIHKIHFLTPACSDSQKLDKYYYFYIIFKTKTKKSGIKGAPTAPQEGIPRTCTFYT